MKKTTVLARLKELQIESEEPHDMGTHDIIQLQILNLLLDYLDDNDLRTAIDEIVV